MAQMTCPQCHGEMTQHRRSGVELAQCQACKGIFLERSELAALIEHENEWHMSSGPSTQPLPRITPDMAAPPASSGRLRRQSFIDELFG
jgi:Zn-finger nucleic acid-binding protein